MVKNINHQLIRRNVISKDVFIDSDATKILFDILCLPVNSNCIGGYVQEISLNPYGFHLLADIQVNIYTTFLNNYITCI